VRELDLLEAMAVEGVNVRYLPGANFPANLVAYPDIEKCVAGARDILVVVPSHG